MELTKEQVQAMAKAIDLEIPEAEINSVVVRLSHLLSAMEEIERDLGDLMDEVDPTPPVYPREEF